MSKFLNSRVPRVAVGMAVIGAFAMAPVAAQAADSNATGTLTAGALSNTAPAFTPFSTALTGLTQTVTTPVGAWDVNDATGSNAGYSVTVAASAPTVGGATAGAGTGRSITLTPTTATATAAANNPAATGPVADAAQTLTPTASTIDNAAAGTGQGEWDFAADTGGAHNLSVVIPGDASAGAYSSTLTYTTAAPVA
jgi:hypothetical protein